MIFLSNMINSHILKISGKSELPNEIEIGHNYHLSLEGSVNSMTEIDNEDGTRNRIYSFRPVKLDLLNSKGETLKLKDTRTKSQLFRGRIYKIWSNNNDMSFEEYYNDLMNNLITNADEVCEMYGYKKTN